MDPIKLILADDDHDSIERMRECISALSDFQIIGQCENGEQLVEEVMVKKPELILTAINMPKKNGMEAVKECMSVFPTVKVIFMTGYDHYAVEAFEIAAVDYMVKPVEKARFFKALEKAKILIAFEQEKRNSRAPQKKVNILPLKVLQATLFIPLEDIYFIEKAGKKCLVYTKQEIYDTNETMGGMLALLDDSFYPAHRSFIINLQRISKIIPQKESFIVHFKDYDQLAKISKLKINEVRERISFVMG